MPEKNSDELDSIEKEKMRITENHSMKSAAEKGAAGALAEGEKLYSNYPEKGAFMLKLEGLADA